MTDWQPFYRARDGWIFGLCKGIARWSSIDVVWVRLAAVTLLLLSGIWPMLAVYFIAALLTRPEPTIPLTDPEQQELHVTYAGSRKHALARLNRRAASLNRRIQRIEHMVTSPEHDWDRRFHHENSSAG